MDTPRYIVYGVATNDAGYPVHSRDPRRRCPYFSVWTNMLSRCYGAAYQARQPTYKGCTVCATWLRFSAFKTWMEGQVWSGKQLDKDLLVLGNKQYSPETCVFVDRRVNAFLTTRTAACGTMPLGVNWDKKALKARARCSNPFTRKLEHLGFFDTADEAHEAWRTRKHELACHYADIQDDPRVASALRTRYL